MGSEARVDVVRASVRAVLVSIGVSLSIWMPMDGAGTFCGVTVGWDRGCEVGGVLIL